MAEARIRKVEICGMTIFAGPGKRPERIKPWIEQFCEATEPNWYVPVDRDWAIDWFNTYGLKDYIDDFDLALEVISDEHSSAWRMLSEERIIQLVTQASNLYGLIHSRWICQARGLALMRKKFENGEFGRCPRVNCDGQFVLPMGTSHRPRRHTAKLFCPRCYDIYVSPMAAKVDGAHFGPAFPGMFLAEFPKFDARKQFAPFARTAFGFKIVRSKLNPCLPHETNRHEEENPK